MDDQALTADVLRVVRAGPAVGVPIGDVCSTLEGTWGRRRVHERCLALIDEGVLYWRDPRRPNRLRALPAAYSDRMPGEVTATPLNFDEGSCP